MTNRVFVYGSMTEGMIHFKKIQAAVASIQLAHASGAAYQLKVGYPVVLKEGQQMIPGQVVELKTSDLMMPLLDEFYGFSPFDPAKSLHLREKIQAQLESGEKVECWIYFLNPKKLPSSATVIDSAQWKESLVAPKFTEQLTERQITYIKRLGLVTGREVVPIDLPLYRELMGLELIVDKGRRLALSKFGQEVYRYLGDS